MKKTIIILALAAILPFVGHAAYPIHSNVKTVNVEKVTGQWNSWNWTWVGRNSQSNTATVLSGTAPIDLANAVLAFKISQNTATGRVTFVNTTNVSLSAISNVIWTINATNIPPNGSYLSELWSYYGATTNQIRTLAQGTIQVVDSLYLPGDSSFPWPSVETNLADYVLRTDADYVAAITGAVYAAQDGITKTGRTLNFGTNLFSGGGGGAGTITNVGVSGGLLTETATGGPSVVIGLTTAAVQAAIAPVGYLTSFTETDPVASTSVWTVAQYPLAVLTDGTRAMGAYLDYNGTYGPSNATGIWGPQPGPYIDLVNGLFSGFTALTDATNKGVEAYSWGSHTTQGYVTNGQTGVTIGLAAGATGGAAGTTNALTSAGLVDIKTLLGAGLPGTVTNGQTGVTLGLGAGSSYAGNVIPTGYVAYVQATITNNPPANGYMLTVSGIGTATTNYYWGVVPTNAAVVAATGLVAGVGYLTSETDPLAFLTNGTRPIVYREGLAVIDIENRQLSRSSANWSIDWETMTLADSAFVGSVNWDTRKLLTSGPITSLDWQDRLLHNSSGDAVLNWSGETISSLVPIYASGSAPIVLTNANAEVWWTGGGAYTQKLFATSSNFTMQINGTNIYFSP